VVALLGHRLRSILRLAQDRHRNPELGRVGADRECEPRRHDPDHLELLTIESDSFAEDTLITAETALPQFVAQNDNAISRFVFLRQKRPAERRLNAEHWKQIG